MNVHRMAKLELPSLPWSRTLRPHLFFKRRVPTSSTPACRPMGTGSLTNLMNLVSAKFMFRASQAQQAGFRSLPQGGESLNGAKTEKNSTTGTSQATLSLSSWKQETIECKWFGVGHCFG